MELEDKKTLKQIHESTIRTETMVGVLVETSKDHEDRIRKGEVLRNRLIGWSLGIGGTTGIISLLKSKLGALL